MTKKTIDLNKAALLAEYLGIEQVFVSENIELKIMNLQYLQHIKSPLTPKDSDFSLSDRVHIFYKNGKVVTVESGTSIKDTIRYQDQSQIRGVIITAVQPKGVDGKEVTHSIYFVSPQDEVMARGHLKKKIIELLLMEDKIASLQAIYNILTKAVKDDSFDSKVICNMVSSRTH